MEAVEGLLIYNEIWIRRNHVIALIRQQAIEAKQDVPEVSVDIEDLLKEAIDMCSRDNRIRPGTIGHAWLKRADAALFALQQSKQENER